MSCELHKTKPRPDLCSDCARVPAARERLSITAEDRGRLVRRTHPVTGRVYFEPVADLIRPERRGPWAQTWD